MLADLRHLSRNIRRSPASAVAAIVTLSLTLGAGAAIFAAVDAIVLTPPPFTDPHALVVIEERPIDDRTSAPRAVGYRTFEEWRERAGPLAAIEAFDGTKLTMTGLGNAERVSATNVTPGFLTLLGVRPAFGRSFDRDDVGRPVVIVSHAFWRGELGADPRAIGRRLVLGGVAHTIVGVLPERFSFLLDACDVWRPFPVTPAEAARRGYRVHGMARLAHQVSPADLAAALDEVSRRSSPPARVVATRVATAIAGDATRMLGVLAAAAALAMLIAFTNLAGLLIVRSIDRQRELAVRSALGAPRHEIAKQLLLEALALVAIGTAGGVLVASWMTPAVAQLMLQQFGDIASRDIALSWRVIAAASGAALACGCGCGLLPALVAARADFADMLRHGATAPPRERALRRIFVAGQVALAFVLLVSVALVGRSLWNVLGVKPGFDARGVLALSVSVPAAKYNTDERVVAFYSALESAVQERFGARAASIVDELPLTGDRGRSLIGLRRGDAAREAVVRTAGVGYFDVMRIPIVAGRPFARGDDFAAPLRVVVSDSLAQTLFGKEQAIGRQLWLASAAQPAEIIGVVGDVKHRALDEPTLPTVYVSAAQLPSHSNILVVRTARPDSDVMATVREEVARLDRDVPVYSARPMRDVVAASPGVPTRRVVTAAFAGFSALAVVLGALGLFGVAAHDVARRRAELALRIALGANPAHILGATLAQTALILVSGLMVGGVMSIWMSRAIGSLIVGTSSVDVLTIGAPAVLLIAAGIVAVLPAARRAARTDPVTALRAE